MFATTDNFRTRVASRAADAIDLLIDLATLGEYGLEYPDAPAARGADAWTCPGTSRSRRTGRERSRPSPRRNPSRTAEPCRSPRQRPTTNSAPSRRHKVGRMARPHPSGRQQAAGRSVDRRHSSNLPDALRPPRIRLSV